MKHGIELRTVVDNLREELSSLTLTAPGEELQFVLEDIELELKVGVTKSGGADAKAKFWVVEVGGKGEYKSDATQTVKLKLKPKLRDAKVGKSTEVLVGDGTCRGLPSSE